MIDVTQNLVIRKLADYPEGERREARFDPHTGQKFLLNPDKNNRREPWPLLGITLETTPERVKISPRLIARGKREGWLEAEGEQVFHRPGGPPEEPWRVTHTFVHFDSVTFKTLEGDVQYRVVGQPDKYVAGGSPTDPVTPEIYEQGDTEVTWYYDLELVTAPRVPVVPEATVTPTPEVTT